MMSPVTGNKRTRLKRVKQTKQARRRRIDLVNLPIGLESATITRPLFPLPLWKRSLDIVGACVLLILLSPVFVIVSLHIKLVSRGPVFYRQERLGLFARPFRIWKFRTMHVDSDAGEHQEYVKTLVHSESPLTKVDKSYRLIRGGKLLRGTAIDEFPQLFNVLAGEMSLVGPRPDVIPLTAYKSWQHARFGAVPGMTGLWQVSGKNKTTFDEMIQLDIQYIEHPSPGSDLKILALTPLALMRQALEA